MPTTPPHRLLWTGPSPSAMLDRLLASETIDPDTIWLVPSPLCRRRVLRALTLHSGACLNPRLWTWDDLWVQVRAHVHEDGPAVLSEVASREFLRAAIREARRDGHLDGLEALAETAGYRRQLRRAFSPWSWQHRSLAERPSDADPATWAVYERYRRLLQGHKVADHPLFEGWAVRRLSTAWTSMAGSSPVVVIAPPSTALERQALKAMIQRSASIHILMSWEDDADRHEVYLDLERMRKGCHAFGFEVETHNLCDDRPGGVLALQKSLFREPEPPLVEQTEGFHLLGSPQGDASALRVTRAVLDRLEAGAALDEVLVLFPRWSDLADRTLETLSEAGVPAWSSHQRPLSSDPGISALRLVLDVAAGEWESTDLAALLRMGSIRLEGFERTDLASAASAIRGLRVFRGYEAIRTRLKRETVLEPDEKDPRKQVKAARAASALRVLEALGRIYSGLEAPASWEDRLDHLEDLQAEFSLFGRALDQLRASLQELGDTRNWLGQADPAWSWRAFSREVLALARELCVEPTTEPSRCVRLAPIAEAVGASARHVILAGLEEGTFPDMESLPTESHDPPPDEGEPSSSECAYAREMRRFLSVLDCANETLTLVYPTTDEKGVSLLPAGFLETLRSRLSDEARCRCEDILRRLDPIVPERLALSGSEQRVRAVGLVCLESAELGLPALRTLAALPTHREALLGTARALRVAAERRRRKRFGPFDGDLRGSAAQPGIAREFGPNRPAPFSASQLETLANCPFQFYLRHVLKLEPTEEPEELDEDYTARGQLIHAALEKMHLALHRSNQPDVPLTRLVHEVVELFVERELEGWLPPASDVDEGLRAIESERLRRTGRRYARQFEEYQEKLGQGATCQQCEVEFGRPNADFPALRLGNENDGLGLQGMIDRIDTVEVDGSTLFRVIDYKTGSCPGRGELNAGLALQLPLYALAVERLILADVGAEPFDVGYWGLRDKGFRPIDQRIKIRSKGTSVDENWAQNLQAAETFVVELVKRLRAAEFPVAPRKDQCTRTCEYKNVCRIGQVRVLKKTWVDAPALKRST